MSETSNFLRTRTLDHNLNTAALTQTQLYLAISTKGPATTPLTPADTGATLAEPSWAARVAIDFNAADLSGPGGIGQAVNDAVIDFVNGSGTDDDIDSCAIVDNPTIGAGNVYYFDNDLPLTTVVDGGTLRFAAGAAAVTQA